MGTGSQWSAISIMGDWGALAFLGYVDLTDCAERDMANLLIDTDPVAPDEEKVHRRG